MDVTFILEYILKKYVHPLSGRYGTYKNKHLVAKFGSM